MIKLMKWTLTNLAIAGGIIAMTPAFSHSASRTARYDDLDLHSATGRATLEQRIGRAVDGVCGIVSATQSSAFRREISRCRADALHGAYSRLATLTRAADRVAGNSIGIVVASR